MMGVSTGLTTPILASVNGTTANLIIRQRGWTAATWTRQVRAILYHHNYMHQADDVIVPEKTIALRNGRKLKCRFAMKKTGLVICKLHHWNTLKCAVIDGLVFSE